MVVYLCVLHSPKREKKKLKLMKRIKPGEQKEEEKKMKIF